MPSGCFVHKPVSPRFTDIFTTSFSSLSGVMIIFHSIVANGISHPAPLLDAGGTPTEIPEPSPPCSTAHITHLIGPSPA
jgi:hypothetical protein